RVNTNIALARLASGRALKIGTKYACEVHTHPPGVDCGFAKSMAGPSLLLQIGSPRFSVELPLDRWQEKIAHYFLSRASNGPTEGFNNGFRTLLRRAYGMTNFHRFRLRVLDRFGHPQPQEST